MKTWLGSWAVAGSTVNGMQVFASWYSVQSFGSDSGLWYALLIVFPLMLALLTIPVFVVMALFPTVRRVAEFGLVAAVLWLATGVVSGHIAGNVRMAGMHALAERSRPLVAAIRRCEAEQGRPPATLNELVPKYIPEVPNTGLGAYPDYEFVTGTAAAFYESNPWVLMVSTPSGGISFDVMAYFPRQNYPEVGYSGWWERVGDWAYLHE